MGSAVVIGALVYLLYRLRKAEKDSAPDRFEKPELADTQWYGHELHAEHHQELEAPVGTQELPIERTPVEIGLNEHEESELRKRIGEERVPERLGTPRASNN